MSSNFLTLYISEVTSSDDCERALKIRSSNPSFQFLTSVLLVICSATFAVSQDSPSAEAAQSADPAQLGKTQGVPRVVKFSGTLKDPEGKPLTGQVQTTFAIYPTQEGGVPAWQETRIVNLDDQGRYTVLLGSTSAEGLPVELFAGDDAHWIAVFTEGTKNLPRTLMVSVPYALKAADADTLGGKPISAFLLADVGLVNNTTKSKRLGESSQAATEKNGTFNTTTANPSPNALAKFDATTNIISSGIFEDASGNVGIGTSAPAGKLDIGSAGGDILLGANYLGTNQLLKAFSTAHATGNVPSQLNLGLQDGSFTGLSIKDVRDGSFNSASMEFSTHHGGLSAGTRMVIDKDGRVGIGSTAPASLLDVGSTGGDITLGSNFQGANQIRKFFSTAHSPSNVPSQINVGLLDGAFTGLNVKDVRDGSFNSASIEFSTHHGGVSAGTRMLIDKDGRVGIGTVNPVAALDVGIGDISVGTNLSGTNQLLKIFTTAHAISNVPSQINMGLLDGAFTGVSVKDVRDGGLNSASIEFATHHGGVSAGTRMLIDKDGNVGIGMAAPIAKIDVSQTAPGVGSFSIGAPPPSAIHGDVTATSGFISGVFGTTSSTDGFGILGENLASGASSGHSAGVRGITANTSTLGTGVWGDALQTSGDNVGVFGHSSSDNGTGVQGLADSATGDAVGVYGRSNSTTGAGVWGEATAGTSVTIGTAILAGVYGKISANGGAAGLFDSVSSGDLLIGRAGANAARVFRVDNTGRMFANGGTATTGADFAESVSVLEPRSTYGPGDIMAIDPTGVRRFKKVDRPYSTLVAGIFSTKPGVLATPHAADDPRHETEEIPLAMVGIVPCKVTSENGKISVGDLLVSSSTPGYAMKGTDRNRMVGAVVGKALQSMTGSTGTIEVLVSLQ
ncbi:MAG: hypothetical protein JWO13_1208 [Acidobacteriales bacterium]|nr:hypothetical protein [Terriglobales bacterium]